MCGEEKTGGAGSSEGEPGPALASREDFLVEVLWKQTPEGVSRSWPGWEEGRTNILGGRTRGFFLAASR